MFAFDACNAPAFVTLNWLLVPALILSPVLYSPTLPEVSELLLILHPPILPEVEYIAPALVTLNWSSSPAVILSAPLEYNPTLPEVRELVLKFQPESLPVFESPLTSKTLPTARYWLSLSISRLPAISLKYSASKSP